MLKVFVGLVVATSFLFSAQRASLVEVEILSKAKVNPVQEFVGSVKFSNSSTLASQTSGLVKSINFEAGKKVKKGDLLVNVDSDLLDTQIDAAKANLAIAKIESKLSQKDYERYEALLKSKSITQKEFENAMLKKESNENSLKILQAKLDELQIQKERKNIKAPYSGILIDKQTNNGEWLNIGSPIGTIVDTSNIELVFNVPENIFYGLKKDAVYDLNIANKSIKAKLYSAIPSGDKLTRTFPVKFKANVNDIFVYDGQEAKVSLAKNSEIDALVVSRDSVIKRFGQQVVFFIDDKMSANMMPVQILGYSGNKIAIGAKGLVEGMQIVKKGNERIFPNSPVKIINKK